MRCTKCFGTMHQTGTSFTCQTCKTVLEGTELADDDLPLLEADNTVTASLSRSAIGRILGIAVLSLLLLGGAAATGLILANNEILEFEVSPNSDAVAKNENTTEPALKFVEGSGGTNALAWPFTTPPILVSQPYNTANFALLIEGRNNTPPTRKIEIVDFDNAGLRLNAQQIATDINGQIEAAAQTSTGTISLVIRNASQYTIAGFNNDGEQIWRHDVSHAQQQDTPSALISWNEALFAMLPGRRTNELELVRFAADGFPDWRKTSSIAATSPIFASLSPLDEIVLLGASSEDVDNVVIEAINTFGNTVLTKDIAVAETATPSALAISETGDIHAFVAGADAAIWTMTYNGEVTHHQSLPTDTYNLPSNACGLIPEFDQTSLLSCVDSAGATLLRVGESTLTTTPLTLNARAISGPSQMLAAGPFGYLSWSEATSSLTHTPIETVGKALAEGPGPIRPAPTKESTEARSAPEEQAPAITETIAPAIPPEENTEEILEAVTIIRNEPLLQEQSPTPQVENPEPVQAAPAPQITVPCRIECVHPTESTARFPVTIDVPLLSGTSLEELSDTYTEQSIALCAEHGGVVFESKNATCRLQP